MRPIAPEELVDYATYEDGRDDFRRRVLEAKRVRRLHLGDFVTVLFENPLTVRYQVQEMMRVERIVREADIQHEIDTYNELLGGAGELGCTLFIEIDDPEERATKLSTWHGLPERFYLVLPDGHRVYARMDGRQEDERRISSVHYLKFDTGGTAPVAAGVAHPGLEVETPLDDHQRAALRDDLLDAT